MRAAAAAGLIAALALARHAAMVALDHDLPIYDNSEHLLRAWVAHREMGEPVPLLQRLLVAARGGDFYPPLVYTASAALWRLAGGPGWDLALTGQGLYLAVFVLSAWSIGARLWGPRAGLLAAAVSAFGPMAANFSFNYDQDFPLAAMVLVNLALVLASDRFRRPVPALLAGLTFGLGVLTKQSFGLFVLPAWALACAAPVATAPTAAWRRGLQLLLLGGGPALIALAVARRILAGPGVETGEVLLAFGGWGLATLAACRSVSGLGGDDEPRRQAHYVLAVLLAVLVASPWLAAHLAQYVEHTRGPVAMDFRRQLAGMPGHLYPGESAWGFHGEAYLRSLLFTTLPLPALGLFALATAGLGRRLLTLEGAMLPACVLFSFAAMSWSPVFREPYVFPVAAMMGVALGWHAARSTRWAALVWAVLGLFLAAQCLAPFPPVRALLGKVPSVHFFRYPAYSQDLAWEGPWLAVREPMAEASELEALLAACEAGPGSVLCFLPDGMGASLAAMTVLRGTHERYLFLVHGDPRPDMVAGRFGGNPRPAEPGEFGTVLVTDPGFVEAEAGKVEGLFGSQRRSIQLEGKLSHEATYALPSAEWIDWPGVHLYRVELRGRDREDALVPGAHLVQEARPLRHPGGAGVLPGVQ